MLTYISAWCIISYAELSLARYSNIAVYANSVIDAGMVGEGFEEPQITNGGALECHTDDNTCCRGIDDTPNGVGRGEWYYPNGNVVRPPSSSDSIYRKRDHMVIRLNINEQVSPPTGVYRCVIPGAGGVTITRLITLQQGTSLMHNHTWEEFF